MTNAAENNETGLLLSGGLDSAILLYHLVEQGHSVRPIYICSGLCWQADELAATRRFIDALNSSRVAPLVTLELPLADLYGEHWSVTGQATPDASTPDEAVYLPGRNALLIIKAALWLQLHGVRTLALGPLASNPFPDATDEFFSAFELSLNLATNGRLRIIRPFAHLEKPAVMRLGLAAPLEYTFSCINPRDGLHCGVCNKCAERQLAFRQVSAADPTRYAERAAAGEDTRGAVRP